MELFGAVRRCIKVCGIAMVVALVLAGCGAGGPVESGVAQIHVTPGAHLFTVAGGSLVLHARVFDAAGNEVADASVTWSSSDPEVASVADDGTVTTTGAVGNALITASAEGVDSFPASIVVAEPVAGAVLLDDAQVLEGPTDVGDPTPPSDPSGPVDQHLLLTGVDDLTPGTIIIGAGTAAIGGSVVSAAATVGGLDVVYTPLPVRDLFESLVIDADVDLSAAPVQPVDDMAGATVRSLGNGVTRVEKPEGGESLLGLKCSGEASSPLVTVNALGTTIENDLTYHVHLNDGTGDPRPTELYVDGSITQKFTSGLTIAAGYSGTYTCKRPVASIPIPIGGVVALVAKPVIPVGVGFSLSGSLQLAGLTVNVETGAGLKLKVGFTGDDAGNVTLLHDADPSFDPPTIKFDLVTPAGFRIGANAFVGLMSGIDLDVIGFDPFGLLKAQLGPQQSFDLAGAVGQAESKEYASSYGLAVVGSIGIGDGIDGIYKWIFGKDVAVQPLQIQVAHDISKSPSGTLSASTTAPAPGEEVHLHVTLGADHLTYLGHYNVSKIELYRSSGTDTPTLWRTIDLNASNQSEFDTVWDTANEEPGDYRFQAFVVDDLLAKVIEVPLEVAADSTVTVHLGGACSAATQGALTALAACTGGTTWDYEQPDDVNGIAWQVHTNASDLTWEQDPSNPTYFHLTSATVSWTDVAEYSAGCSTTSSGNGLHVTNTDSDAGTFVSGLLILQNDGTYWGSGYVYVVDAANDGCFGGTKDENVPLFVTGDETHTLEDDGTGGSYLVGTYHAPPAPDQIGTLDTSWSFHFADVAAPPG